MEMEWTISPSTWSPLFSLSLLSPLNLIQFCQLEPPSLWKRYRYDARLGISRCDDDDSWWWCIIGPILRPKKWVLFFSHTRIAPLSVSGTSWPRCVVGVRMGKWGESSRVRRSKGGGSSTFIVFDAEPACPHPFQWWQGERGWRIYRVVWKSTSYTPSFLHYILKHKFMGLLNIRHWIM